MSPKAFLKLSLATVCCSIFFLSNAKAEATFPADIPLCNYGDTACVVNSATLLIRQYGTKGYTSAAFPKVEPFLLKEVDISDGRTGSLNLKLNFREVNVLGLSAGKFDRAVGFEADPSTSKFEIYGGFPKVTIRAKYLADGRILILPIRGDGDADIILDKVKFSVKFKPSIHPKNGKTYLMVEKLKVLLEPQKMTINLTNLFNGDQALGSHMNQFLNENWSDVWTELQPSIDSAIAEVVKSVVEPIFKKFAYEDIFLS